MIEEKIKQAIKLLKEAFIEEQNLKEQNLKFEDLNFRVNSDGWKKITVDGEKYLVNPESDIWEIITGDYQGEQLFTWKSAIRETTRAGKRMPTDEEFMELLKTKEDMSNLILAGYHFPDGTFYSRGTDATFWSSAESESSAWYRSLNATLAAVYRNTHDKAYGFSVRCLKKH